MVSSNSLITKKVIAYSFKSLLRNKEFQKISIKEIMEQADLRRQTFYDYFSDKYELLTWIFNQELTETIDHFLSYEKWTDVVYRLLNYFYKNRLFYQKITRLSDIDSFETCLINHSEILIKTALIDNQNSNLSEKQQNDNVLFFAYGFSGMIRNWLLTKCISPPDEIATYLVSVINFTLLIP